MKKTMTIILLLLTLIPVATALSVSRGFSKTGVATGEQINITYTPSSTSIKFWAINEPIPGGWSVVSANRVGGSLNEYGDCLVSDGILRCTSASQTEGETATSIVATWKASSTAGTSTFTGDWAIETDKSTFASQLVTITGQACTDGQTRTCTVDDCAGTETCSNGVWGSCVKDDPECGVDECVTDSDCGTDEKCVDGICESTICEVGTGLTECVFDQDIGFDCCVRVWHVGLILLFVFAAIK